MFRNGRLSRGAVLRESILSCKNTVHIKTLQRFQGKCVSLCLAVPAVKLFIREMSFGIVNVSPKGLVHLSRNLREELSYWRFP